MQVTAEHCIVRPVVVTKTPSSSVYIPFHGLYDSGIVHLVFFLIVNLQTRTHFKPYGNWQSSGQSGVVA